MRFRDRQDAGRQLAQRVGHLRGSDVVVLGLPRGGVPVARVVADELRAPLDVLIVRKLGFPSHPEFGMGAIGEGNVRVLDTQLVARYGISEPEIDEVEARERVELDRRVRKYRGNRAPASLAGRTALIVDDGLATGGSARAAMQVARAMGARRVILAVPVAPPDTVASLSREADEIITLTMPSQFRAIGEWYDDFAATSDAEVLAALESGPRTVAAAAPPTPSGPSSSSEVRIPIGSVSLEGFLDIPEAARGVVVFAHGSGSSRQSVRNLAVARRLRASGFATLLFDLLTDVEANDRTLVFDTELLARRLLEVTKWVERQGYIGGLPIGLFGASTGAGAALRVAADPDAHIRAVVSRGGRPDLAGDRLPCVRGPVLLIVGGADEPTLRVNREAAASLRCRHQLTIVRGATHLFEEPGALETVAELAAEWFEGHLDTREAPRDLPAPIHR